MQSEYNKVLYAQQQIIEQMGLHIAELHKKLANFERELNKESLARISLEEKQRRDSQDQWAMIKSILEEDE
ncbi:MAG: hypothetical protein ACOC5T_07345 [Elusimicrobiota bacterium]